MTSFLSPSSDRQHFFFALAVLGGAPMDALAEGTAAVIVRASNLQGASQESLCYVEVTHEGASSDHQQTTLTNTRHQHPALEFRRFRRRAEANLTRLTRRIFRLKWISGSLSCKTPPATHRRGRNSLGSRFVSEREEREGQAGGGG
ncbi:unnamed protein product [Ectocarpus sp. CCAP 1310/34]|nr:unnamed protein product [Ectocarpus sp. CCAP 1310/34]